jgi:hypothetical protein
MYREEARRERSERFSRSENYCMYREEARRERSERFSRSENY